MSGIGNIANNVTIVDNDHDYKHGKNKFVIAPAKIGNRVWIEANCVIFKGVILVDDSVVAFGSYCPGIYSAKNFVLRKKLTV